MKKLLCIFLTLSVLLACAPLSGFAAAEDIWFAPLAVAHTETDAVRASVNLKNNSAQESEALCVFACYDGTQLKQVTLQTPVVPAGNEQLAYADFDLSGCAAPVIKAFRWETGSMEPLGTQYVRDEKLWQEYASAVSVSTVTNEFKTVARGTILTYRTYVMPEKAFDTQTWRFWFSNILDASRAGFLEQANQKGGNWRILSASIADGGTAPDGSVSDLKELTYNGAFSKDVRPGEEFWTDEITYTLPEGHFLAFTWTIEALDDSTLLPQCVESITPVFVAENSPIPEFSYQETANGFANAPNVYTISGKTAYGIHGMMPSLFAVKKDVTKRMAFVGDSITQGTFTTPGENGFWVGQIAKRMDDSVSVWNMGSGYSKAIDGATNGAWLAKAKNADEITLTLGVNDIGLGRSADQIIGDIQKMVASLRQANPNCIITLNSLPPFNSEGGVGRETWLAVNRYILSKAPVELDIDHVFNIADILTETNLSSSTIRQEYRSFMGDPHPNETAGAVIAEAYMDLYNKRGGEEDYTISFDIKPTQAAVGWTFSYTDKASNMMYQLYDHEGRVYLRPHTFYQDQWRLEAEVDITHIIPTAEYYTWHNIRIEISAADRLAKTYVDGQLADCTPISHLVYQRSFVGLRNGANEGGCYDNFLVTDAGGQTLFSEDFENSATCRFNTQATGLSVGTENGNRYLQAIGGEFILPN